MRKQLKALLQKIFGFNNYLLAYSLYSIRKSLHGKYEEEFDYFIQLIPATGIILDIGANIGITAVALSKFKKAAEVHAFEPIIENFRTLQKVSSIYKISGLKLYNLALGNNNGMLKMILPVINHARQQGLSRVYDESEDVNGKVYNVPVKRLDDLYPGTSSIIAIKIDVENYELEVLQGAIHILEVCRPVIFCELWRNEKRYMVFDFLEKCHYGRYLYNKQTKALEKIQGKVPDSIYNFFFLPN